MSPKTQNHGRLAGTSAGTTVRITGVDGGMRVQSRLVGMGLITGTNLDVRSNDGGGPVLVAVGHARIALGRGMAEKVRVESVAVQAPGGNRERRSA
jgi:ferrous iron transport protein A